MTVTVLLNTHTHTHREREREREICRLCRQCPQTFPRHIERVRVRDVALVLTLPPAGMQSLQHPVRRVFAQQGGNGPQSGLA